MIPLALLTVPLLTSCAASKTQTAAANSGAVAFRALQSEEPDSYAEGEGVVYMGAFASPGNATPLYPPELVPRRLPPVTMQARVIVGERGDVTEVVPLTPVSPDDAPFLAAIEAALERWVYMPLVRVERGVGGKTTLETHEGKMEFSGKAVALPFRLDYEFTFSQRDGEGTVSPVRRVTPEPAPGR